MTKDIKAGTNWMIRIKKFQVKIILFLSIPYLVRLMEIKLLFRRTLLTRNLKEETIYTQKSLASSLKHQMEYTYAKMRLPLVALVLTLLAIAAFVLSSNFTYTLVFSFLTIAVQLVYIIMRIMISAVPRLLICTKQSYFQALPHYFSPSLLGTSRKSQCT